MTTNTAKIIDAFIQSVDTSNEYSLAELNKLLKEVYITKPKKINKKKEDEEPKKKREPSAYNKFVKAKVQILKQENSEIPAKELMTMASKLWKELSDEQKAEYK